MMLPIGVYLNWGLVANNEGIIIPEEILFTTIKAVLDFVRVDFDNHTNEKDTVLYKVVTDNNIERYKMFEQAKKVFLADKTDPRYLDCNLFFNKKRANIPTIHITLPSETGGAFDGVGLDEGYVDAEYDEDAGTNRANYTRSFSTNYNIIVTSDNTNEVVLIYHTLRALLIPVFNHLDSKGLRNVKLGGSDIQINPQLVPQGIFLRNISISFQYEITSTDFYDEDTISKLIFNGIILEIDKAEADESVSTGGASNPSNTNLTLEEVLTNGNATLLDIDFLGVAGIVRMKDPVNDQDAATKKYVDDLVDGINVDVSWGNISGTLSDQNDLQLALNGKSNTGHIHNESDITDLDKYTQSQVDNLLGNYYTKSLLDGGQLDNRYYTEAEVNNLIPVNSDFSLVGLSDTPANYSGSAGYFLKVNSTPDAVEFVDPGTINLSSFNDDLDYYTTAQVDALIPATYWQDDGSGNISNTNAGNVGIGTLLAPLYNLHLRGSNNGGEYIAAFINNDTTTNGSSASIGFRVGNDANAAPTAKIENYRTSVGTIMDLVFHTWDSGLSEKLRIKGTGEIGINVDPSHQYHQKATTNNGTTVFKVEDSDNISAMSLTDEGTLNIGNAPTSTSNNVLVYDGNTISQRAASSIVSEHSNWSLNNYMTAVDYLLNSGGSEFTAVTRFGGTLPAGLSASTTFVVYNTSSNTDRAVQYILSGNAGRSTILFGDTDDTSRGEITYDHTDESLRFLTNNLVEAGRITSGQNWLINTSTNIGEKLTLNGRLALAETTAPTNIAGYGKFYASSVDNLAHFLDSSGNDYNIVTDIAGKGSSALAQAPTATEDGFVLAWDEAASEYDLVQSGGIWTSETVNTTDATATTIETIAVPSSTTIGIKGEVVARRTGGTAGTAEDGAYYLIEFTAKNVAGTATLIGQNISIVGEDQAAWDVSLLESSGNIVVQVTGAANNNITWVWKGKQIST